MPRSLKKGHYVDPKLSKKIEKAKPGDKIKTWSRRSTVTPEMLGIYFLVHNGKDFIEVLVDEDKVGHKLGEFAPTRRFSRHGGKMQKELDQAAKQRDIEASKAAKADSAKK